MDLADNRPGVHVKGQVEEPQKGKPPRVQTNKSDVDTDEDEPIMMRTSRSSERPSGGPRKGKDDGPVQKTQTVEALTSGGALNTGGSGKGSDVDPSHNFGLLPLMSNQAVPAALPGTGAQPVSVLTHLLNTTSNSSPAKASVGQILAKVLDKASKDASNTQPARAESLRNLAKYFSEKERQGSPTKTQPPKVSIPPPVSPTVNPSTGGGLLSTILASRGLSVGIPSSKPVTTTANTAGLITMTTSTLLSRGGLMRNSSGGDLMALARGSSSEMDTSEKRQSLDSATLRRASTTLADLNMETFAPLPRMSRRASSGDLQEMFSSSPDSDPFAGSVGNRLKRSSSIGNLKDLPQNERPSGSIGDSDGGGFFGRLRRSPSLGSLTNLVQKANIGATVAPSSAGSLPQRSSSFDSDSVKLGQSPPSPSRFESSGGLGFFGNSFSTPNNSVTPTDPPLGPPRGGLFAGARLSGLTGVGNIWSKGPRRDAGLSTSSPSVPTAVEKAPSSEERLDKINQAFAFEDFGGLGLMSFFGGKSRRPRSSNE